MARNADDIACNGRGLGFHFAIFAGNAKVVYNVCLSQREIAWLSRQRRMSLLCVIGRAPKAAEQWQFT